jgi:glutaminyl-peptide cyclotransferase
MLFLKSIVKALLFCFTILSIVSCGIAGAEPQVSKPSQDRSAEPAPITESSGVTPSLAKTPESTPTAASTITPTPSASATMIPSPLIVPTLGAGSILLPPESSAAPPIRKYVCPWLDMPGGVPQYSYKILNTYPHDISSYTEGLVFHDGYLYESTGLHGSSTLRKVELKTGQPLQIQKLSEAYFGEGIALFGDRIFMLTWKERTGFIFDLNMFDLLDQFAYFGEGWGLTNDGQSLIMSNGSNQLFFLDPDGLQSEKIVQVTTAGIPVQKLNELEYMNGEIWANVYLTSCIARIDPQDGKVLGWIDLSGMLTRAEMAFAEVPNGIAYDPQTRRIIVTGKFWPKLFEIELVPPL